MSGLWITFNDQYYEHLLMGRDVVPEEQRPIFQTRRLQFSTANLAYLNESICEMVQ